MTNAFTIIAYGRIAYISLLNRDPVTPAFTDYIAWIWHWYNKRKIYDTKAF